MDSAVLGEPGTSMVVDVSWARPGPTLPENGRSTIYPYRDGLLAHIPDGQLGRSWGQARGGVGRPASSVHALPLRSRAAAMPGRAGRLRRWPREADCTVSEWAWPGSPPWARDLQPRKFLLPGSNR